MKKLETIESEVKKILDKDIRARKDDMYLYYVYCTKYGVLNEKAFVQLFYNKNFRKYYNVPVFESVSRARRKLQQEYEYLRPDKKEKSSLVYSEMNYDINKRITPRQRRQNLMGFLASLINRNFFY